MTFFWPWLLLLLPLPLLIQCLLPSSLLNSAQKHNLRALKLPGYDHLVLVSLAQNRSKIFHRQLLFPWLIWISLVISVSQPLWLDDKSNIPISGRDLMLLIDASGSMRKMDFIRITDSRKAQVNSSQISTQSIDSFNNSSISRLEIVKELAAIFIQQRTGDRTGFILFGDRPYLRSALSYDKKAIVQLINESEIALAGESTAIGDAIGLAIKRMKNLVSKSRVIVLLTDGANNEGMVNPRKAAQLAASLGIRIYTIGIGKATEPGPNPYGLWSTDNAQRFEEQVLKDIAKITGGQYFHALDSKGLQVAYQRLNELEPALHPQIQKHLAYALYPWTLTFAIVLSILGLFNHRLPQMEALKND